VKVTTSAEEKRTIELTGTDCAIVFRGDDGEAEVFGYRSPKDQLITVNMNRLLVCVHLLDNFDLFLTMYERIEKKHARELTKDLIEKAKA
jgi:hypothetical protein